MGTEVEMTEAVDAPQKPADIGPGVQHALAEVVAALEPLDDDSRARVLLAVHALCGLPSKGQLFLEGILESAKDLFPKIIEVYQATHEGGTPPAPADVEGLEPPPCVP